MRWAGLGRAGWTLDCAGLGRAQLGRAGLFGLGCARLSWDELR